jgi:hypothetical protein
MLVLCKSTRFGRDLIEDCTTPDRVGDKIEHWAAHVRGGCREVLFSRPATNVSL